MKSDELVYWNACDSCKVLNGAPYCGSDHAFVESLNSRWNKEGDKCMHCEQSGKWVVLDAPGSLKGDVHGEKIYKMYLLNKGWKRM